LISFQSLPSSRYSLQTGQRKESAVLTAFEDEDEKILLLSLL